MSSPNIRPLRPAGVRHHCLSFTLLLSLGLQACEHAIASDEEGRPVDAIGPELAVSWNRLAYDIAYAEDQFLTFKGQRAIAMVHLAVHDALQAVVPLYRPYVHDGREPDADPLIAAAQAAHDVLLAAYPDRADTIEAELSTWLEGAHEGSAKDLGRTLGAASAAALIAARAGDGWDQAGSYDFGAEPGQYHTTPPWNGFVLQPGFRHAVPFSFHDPASFRPPPPPALDSQEYAAALAEVRAFGDSSSTDRSDDETGYAIWWMEFSESSAGRVVRRLLEERRPSLWDANRLLAHMYMALFDGYVSNWDSKYEFNHWRPYTAVRMAGSGGTMNVEPDSGWVPLRPSPPFPEYASAHATGCAAAYTVAARFFGDSVTFENTSLTAPEGMPARSFSSFGAAAEECADSRVKLGWHFRYSTDAGLEAGRKVANHVMDSTLGPR